MPSSHVFQAHFLAATQCLYYNLILRSQFWKHKVKNKPFGRLLFAACSSQSPSPVAVCSYSFCVHLSSSSSPFPIFRSSQTSPWSPAHRIQEEICTSHARPCFLLIGPLYTKISWKHGNMPRGNCDEIAFIEKVTFKLNVKSNRNCIVFIFTSVCDWFKKTSATL